MQSPAPAPSPAHAPAAPHPPALVAESEYIGEVEDHKCIDLKAIPVASLIKEAFFAVHLFKEQIFSMSGHVEMMLYDFLLVNRQDCCGDHGVDAMKDEMGSPIWIHLCHLAGHYTKKPHNKSWNESTVHMEKQFERWAAINHFEREDEKMNDEESKKWNQLRTRKIFKMSFRVREILWMKFNEFRMTPNPEQRIKFDRISTKL